MIIILITTKSWKLYGLTGFLYLRIKKGMIIILITTNSCKLYGPTGFLLSEDEELRTMRIILSSVNSRLRFYLLKMCSEILTYTN